MTLITKSLVGLLVSIFLVSSVQYGTLPLNIKYNDLQVLCLADNIHHEAAGESFLGKIAVAFVTLNRVTDKKFPPSVCKVVYQAANGVCQFSWVCNPFRRPRSGVSWQDSLHAAQYVYYNYYTAFDPTQGSKFFHATYVKPKWKKTKQKIVQIDNHIFYKTKAK